MEGMSILVPYLEQVSPDEPPIAPLPLSWHRRPAHILRLSTRSMVPRRASSCAACRGAMGCHPA